MRRVLQLFVIAALASRGVNAQSTSSTSPAAPAPPPAELQHAATAFAAGNWTQANAEYTALAQRFPGHPLVNFRTGVTLTELGRAAEGEKYLRLGERLGIPAPQAEYRLAESFAEQRKLDSAAAALLRSAGAGFYLPPPVLDGNAHFAVLKSQLEKAGIKITPVSANVTVAQSAAADDLPTPSRNRITLEENGCVVQEHWQAGGGAASGQSFNLFDGSIGKWRQTWVDNSGGQHDYVGALVDGNMVFEGTTPAPNGQLGRIPTRLTLFHVSKDTVRQFSQTSADGGKTWTTSYDLTYVRRAP